MAESPERQTVPFVALNPKGQTRLTVAHGPCPSGMSFVLGGSQHMIGRTKGDVVLAEDPALSPEHALLHRENGTLKIEDRGSVNGVWKRLREPVPLTSGTTFRVGSNYFRFEVLSADEGVQPDGTRYFVSPKRRGSFRVLQILEGGVAGLSATSSSDDMTIGAAGATVSLGSDSHMSQQHARIRAVDGAYMLIDLGSTNGTYVRVEGTVDLVSGDAFFVGSSLLRVDEA